jgi:hypothetical protein
MKLPQGGLEEEKWMQEQVRPKYLVIAVDKVHKLREGTYSQGVIYEKGGH